MPAATETHYDVLGLPPAAKEQEIKRSFRRMALEHHPDRPGGNADIFKRAVEAYEILTDRQKRAEYDNSISGARTSWRPSAAQSAAHAAASGTSSGTSKRRPRSEFRWSFFNAPPRRSSTTASEGEEPRPSSFNKPFGSMPFSGSRSRKAPYMFPFFAFDTFAFPDPPFMRAEPHEPPPRRPRSSRFEQMRAQQPFSFDAGSDENDSEMDDDEGWAGFEEEIAAERAETARRRAEAERKRAEAERRRAKAERVKIERAKAEMARMRAEAEERERAAAAELNARFDARLHAEQNRAEADASAAAAAAAAAAAGHPGGYGYTPGQAGGEAFGQTGSDAPSDPLTGSRRRPRGADADSSSSAEPQAKRPRVEPEIVDLTADDGAEPVSGKRKRSAADANFDMSDMRRVPPFTQRDGSSFDLHGVQSAVPDREDVRLRQQNRARAAPAPAPEQVATERAHAEQARLWSQYVHATYGAYDRLFQLHNSRTELVDREGAVNREAVVANLQETAEWLSLLLRDTQQCLPPRLQ